MLESSDSESDNGRMNQTELRKKILSIQQNSCYTPQEKARMIQVLSINSRIS